MQCNSSQSQVAVRQRTLEAKEQRGYKSRWQNHRKLSGHCNSKTSISSQRFVTNERTEIPDAKIRGPTCEPEEAHTNPYRNTSKAIITVQRHVVGSDEV